MKTKKIVVAILLTALLTSCKEESAVIQFEQTDTFKTLSEVKLPKPNQDELTLDSEFIDSTLEVLEKMTKMYYEDTNLENYVVSPMSLYYALSMINNGTSNANENEISKFLSINNMNKANDNLKKHYQNNYYKTKSAYEKVSNSLWINNNYEVKEMFVNILEDNFYSDFYSVDFSDNQTIENIAKWVNFNTENFLNKTSEDYKYLNDINTNMTLINTIYFNCSWEYEAVKNTIKEEFKGLNNAIITDFFYKSAKGTFLQKDQYLIFNDTFVNGSKVYYILPNENVNLKDLLNNENIYNEIFDFIKSPTVEKSIIYKAPEFDILYNVKFIEILEKMGCLINDIEFENIIENKNLKISNIIQDNRIVFSKNGVEVASETQVDSLTSSHVKIELNTIINRPFMFIITDSQNTPLFTGSLFDL